MDDFTNPNPQLLARRSDEELIAYVRAARDRGAAGAVHAAFMALQYRHQDRVRGRLMLKLPHDRVDDAVQDVFLDAFRAIVDGGKAIERFRAWLNAVVANTVAEFWRGKEGRGVQNAREGVQLDDDRAGSAAYELADDGGFGASDASIVVEELIARRRPNHQAIVRMNVLEGRSANEVAAATDETAANVYQVAKRFRDELRAVLHGAAHDDPTDDRT
jgi:RNA polymerase sigma factor (sigma-70 family)